MTWFIKSGVFESLGGVAVAKVDVARQSNGWPAGLFKDTTEPPSCAAADGTLQKSCRLGLGSAGTLEGIGAVTNSFGRLSFVILFPAKSFGIVLPRWTRIITTLLTIGRKGRKDA